jgi:hypothetical protein
VDLASKMGDLLDNLYAAFETGETENWEHGLAPDAVVIGTDDVEWWQGGDDVLPILRAQVAEMHEAGVRIRRGQSLIAATADTVWAADRPIMMLADGTEVQLRLTAVATPHNDRLLVRQLHFSIGVPNEEVLSEPLTV